jgi:hypothetical protein
MFCDEAKYGIACHQSCVELECALSDVSIGKRHVQPVATKIAPKTAEIYPVRERRLMNLNVLQQLTDLRARRQIICAAENLRNHQGRKKNGNISEQFAERFERPFAELIDQDR